MPGYLFDLRGRVRGLRGAHTGRKGLIQGVHRPSIAMTRYNRGANRERQVAEMLRSQGWIVMRSAASHGPADLIAMKDGEVRLLQVKTDVRGPWANFGPKDRGELRCMADQAGAAAELIYWPANKPMRVISTFDWPA